ncbi:LysR family transcriptional regulator [Herbaspirillum sp. WGmk3]|uniref:LysR family transcriptional regulator n=1 Tax=Herbaspirillum sp. WGmk3 TaxID=2919925 RepID=UPI0020917215|nr:LysR family transcriptional regulator [Herbaspirillum sp. WGmk3]MCO4856198.1 LysR family transcriptional regulator [Herbaspirillum sp. WGmk3]
METPISLDLLSTFVAVAELRSFSRAAEQLGVAKGTVSRAITALEQSLGTELLHRSTHRVDLSTAGIALYHRAREPVDLLRRAVQSLPERDEMPSGLLKILVVWDFAEILLPAALAAFSQRYPRVRFDVRVAGPFVDWGKENFDIGIAVVTGPLKDCNLKLRKLGRSTAGFYASPGYLSRRGKPRNLEDVEHSWILHPEVVRRYRMNPEHVSFQIDDFLIARELLISGAGIGLLPGFVARAPLRAGLLERVPVKKEFQPLHGDWALLYSGNGTVSKKVIAFRDFLCEVVDID